MQRPGIPFTNTELATANTLLTLSNPLHSNLCELPPWCKHNSSVLYMYGSEIRECRLVHPPSPERFQVQFSDGTRKVGISVDQINVKPTNRSKNLVDDIIQVISILSKSPPPRYTLSAPWWPQPEDAHSFLCARTLCMHANSYLIQLVAIIILDCNATEKYKCKIFTRLHAFIMSGLVTLHLITSVAMLASTAEYKYVGNDPYVNWVINVA
jgi:hypothetical protein